MTVTSDVDDRFVDSSSSTSPPSSSSASSKQMMTLGVFDDNDNDLDGGGDLDGLFFNDDDDDDNNDVYDIENDHPNYDIDIDDDDDVGPNVILNDEDLFMLHNIDIPRSTTTTATNSLNGNDAKRTGSVATHSTQRLTDEGSSNNVDTSGHETSSTIPIDIALSSDLSYFYLRDGLGLSEDVMLKLTKNAPSVLGFKADNLREKVRVLKSILGLSDEELRQLVTSHPNILQLSARKNVGPTILFLLRQLDLGKKELKTLILGCPTLLNLSIGNINNKLVFFQETMGYSVTECRNLLLSDPRLLRCSVEGGLIPRLSFLHKEVEIPIPDLRMIVRKNPSILMMSVELNLQPKIIFYFIMTLRMTPDQVRKVLLKYPHILDYNLDNHIRPIHTYFLNLDFSTQEFANIIRRFPQIVSNSLGRIKQRIEYLRCELCLDADSIRRIVHQSPQFIGLTQERIKTAVDYLLDVVSPGATLSVNNNNNLVAVGATDNKSHGHNNSNNNNDDEWKGNSDNSTSNYHSNKTNKNITPPLLIVQKIVTGLPSLLTLNIENNLQPKVEYLRQTMGQRELSDALMRMPPLLGYSLTNRIMPRMEALINAGVDVGKITVGIPKKEEDFYRWLEGRAKERMVNDMGSADESTTTTTTLTIQQESSLKLTGTSPGMTTTTGEEDTKKTISEPGLNQDVQDSGGRVVEEGGRIIHWRRPSR